ncbi:putative MFS-type transporter YhjX [Folsomia candida]|uniref:Putative MFS-type transporter YhjX n=1 Tax=Folsomia candida TaxID=158441 RepID=A0A226EGR8_FOLCA|nr:putative MFS-type transporter YhjX [Folsomia candida]
MTSTQSSQEVLADHDTVGGDNTSNKAKSTNIFLRLIQYHYRVTKYEKSEEQVLRESKLLPCIPFNRWFLIPAAVIIQFCCGSLYAWSVFNQPIDVLIYGEVVNMAPITFYIAVGSFGLSRNGPMVSCLLGTTLFVVGNYITALALYLRLIWLVFVGYGITSGVGLGICYISPVSALQKWFPDKRGMASGLAVCGFGAGSIIFAKVQLPLYNNVGLPLTFVVLGSVYLVLMVLSGLVLRTPPPNFSVGSDQTENGKVVEAHANGDPPDKISLIDALTSNNYRFMYAMLLANSIFGLVVISRLANMTKEIFGKTPDEGATVVSINGLFNLGGRLCFSILSDYIGRKNCFIIMLTSQLIILGSFSTITTTQTYWAFLMTMFIISSCYGAGFGVIPAFLSDTFGATNIGSAHGLILTAWSLAGVCGGLTFTAVFNAYRDGAHPSDPHPYNINVWWIFGVVFLGWIALLFVTPTAKDRAFTRRPRSFFRSIINRITNRERSFEMN